MKKSELVDKVDVSRLAIELGLSETDIKLAVTHIPPTFDTKSINRITTVVAAKKRFDRTKSLDIRALVLERAISLCDTLDDLDFVRINFGFEHVSSGMRLAGQHSLRTRVVVQQMLERASDFPTVHKIWAERDSENLAAEDEIALKMMEMLIPSTDTVTVLELLEGDIGFEVYSNKNLVHYSLVILACDHATPHQALAALKHMKEHGFDGEQDCLPVRLLIQKAAQLFPK